MKLFHKNPRQITTKQFSDLGRWMDEFGDLSGIVHDLNSDEIIGGNQRYRIFDLGEYTIQMTWQREEPDRVGTVGEGKIIWHGIEWNYRQVRWTPEQCDQACLIANKAGGTFDFETLANQFDLSLILASGFTDRELQITPKSSGDLLSLINITLAEPKHKVNHGDIWRVGKHILICAEVMTEWERWVKYLQPETILATYPGPLAPLTQLSEKYHLLMIQPNTYISGHILDRYSEINGDDSVYYDSNCGIVVQ